MRRVVQEVLRPAARRFQPDFILVSAGGLEGNCRWPPSPGWHPFGILDLTGTFTHQLT